LPGDWLWVGESTDWPLHCAPRALTTLLGREFTHAVLDARYGFDVAALAALSGTLKPGSFLVLLTPPLTEWAQRPDKDSCRWSDTAEPIATPRFVEHFCRALRQDENVILWSRAYQFPLPAFTARPAWHAATGAPEREQAEVLAELADDAAGRYGGDGTARARQIGAGGHAYCASGNDGHGDCAGACRNGCACPLCRRD
jgi:tRNA(Met) cytidine acetyltransferase